MKHIISNFKDTSVSAWGVGSADTKRGAAEATAQSLVQISASGN